MRLFDVEAGYPVSCRVLAGTAVLALPPFYVLFGHSTTLFAILRDASGAHLLGGGANSSEER